MFYHPSVPNIEHLLIIELVEVLPFDVELRGFVWRLRYFSFVASSISGLFALREQIPKVITSQHLSVTKNRTKGTLP